MQYWLFSSPEPIFVFNTQRLVIEFPERTSCCPEPKAFKTFPHKKHIAVPMTRGRDKRRTWPQGFGTFMANWCAVVWCGGDLWVEVAHSNLPCFALCRRTTPNKQRAPKPYNQCLCKEDEKVPQQQRQSWAAGSNVLLNETKTKQMVITTKQMSGVHHLELELIVHTHRTSCRSSWSRGFVT